MHSANLLARGVLLGALLWSAGASADCHYQNKLYPEGTALCRGPQQFQCGPMAAWRKLPASCPVPPHESQTPAAGKPTDKSPDTGAPLPHDKAS